MMTLYIVALIVLILAILLYYNVLFLDDILLYGWKIATTYFFTLFIVWIFNHQIEIPYPLSVSVTFYILLLFRIISWVILYYIQEPPEDGFE